jgi:HK97 gp10 family phage protein
VRLYAKLDPTVAILDRLRLLEGLADGAQVDGILVEGGEIIATEWRARVPQPGADHPYSTGEYHDSISVEVQREGGLGDPTVLVGTNAENVEDGYPYPIALEYGTSKMNPQPSFGPAIEAAGPLAADHVGARIAQRAEEIW